MRLALYLVLLLTGLLLALPGAYLALAGGSVYYLAGGIAVLVCAELFRRRSRQSVDLFWVFISITAAWAVWEVGFDGWALMPRLVFLFAIGVCLIPFARKKLLLAAVAVTLPAVLVIGAAATHRESIVTPNRLTGVAAVLSSEWPTYGNTASGTRYARASQIKPENVGSLRRAWVYHMAGKTGRDTGGLELTPLMVDNKIFGCTGLSDVFALDPVSGKEVWRANAQLDQAKRGHAVCRGVAFYRAGLNQAECSNRIFVGTVDNRLIALDAEAGTPCRSFGRDGSVDLAMGLGPVPKGWTNPTSPPVVVNGIVVVGGFIVDNQSTAVPSGVVRGYDAVTGALKWVFDPARLSDRSSMGEAGSYQAGSPNSWAPATVDHKLGLIYLPMGNGSPDFYGVHRNLATERYSSAVVALDASTGVVRWVFQTVHHDLWDYDLAAQPVLIDFPTKSGLVPALIQATKTGQLFVLDRRTGVALTKVEERSVPASHIPGERWAHTQPYSVGMPDFAGPDLREVDMWGMTPFDQLYCRIRFRQARHDGRYTPPGLGYSIRFPGELGGIDWGGVSVDETNGLLFVNSNRMADWDELITRAQADKEQLFARDGTRPGYQPHGAPGAAMAGTPYGVHWRAFTTGLGIPCQRPPYGFLTAVSLRTRKIVWQHALGDASNSGPLGLALGLPFTLGAPNIGGSIVTAGGVVFIGATQDKYFRAIAEADGRTLWRDRLPAGGHATPMTYLGRDKRQYVVIAAGGNGSFGTGADDSLIAYRLGN